MSRVLEWLVEVEDEYIMGYKTSIESSFQSIEKRSWRDYNYQFDTWIRCF